MIERTYNYVPEVAHCPVCRRPVFLPPFAKQIITKRLEVGCKNPRCGKGRVVIVSARPVDVKPMEMGTD